MNKIPKISIPNPCTENWAAMMPDEKGRFCAACQTSVQDFTSFSDTELISFFQQKQIPACGRFAQRQLEVLNSQNEAKSGILKTISKYAAAAFIGATILPHNSLAQETIIQEKQSDVQQGASPQTSTGSTVVTGTVTDKNGEPVIACLISLKGSDINTFSDEYGLFRIEVSEDNSRDIVLVFEAIGWETKELSVSSRRELNIRLDVSLDYVVTLGVVVYTKPTLWQRITRPFKRLF